MWPRRSVRRSDRDRTSAGRRHDRSAGRSPLSARRRPAISDGSPDSSLLNGPSSGPPQYSPGLHVPPATVVASLPVDVDLQLATWSVVRVRVDVLVSAIASPPLIEAPLRRCPWHRIFRLLLAHRPSACRLRSVLSPVHSTNWAASSTKHLGNPVGVNPGTNPGPVGEPLPALRQGPSSITSPPVGLGDLPIRLRCPDGA